VARLTNATRIAQPGFAPVRQPNSLITGRVADAVPLSVDVGIAEATANTVKAWAADGAPLQPHLCTSLRPYSPALGYPRRYLLNTTGTGGFGRHDRISSGVGR
jgi:hypothetical protein